MDETNIYRETVATDFGSYQIISDEVAINQVVLINKSDSISSNKPSALTSEATQQLTAYFKGDLKKFDLPLCQPGTDFQQQVWDYLLTIPYGETVSYGQIANAFDNPGAVRAVGAANGKNQMPIIVPCHRVIASSGKLQGYALGVDLKRRLINLERSKSPQFLF